MRPQRILLVFTTLALTYIGLASNAFCSPPSTAGNAILIDFSSDHCPPCLAMKPVLAELERSGVPIRHVNVGTESDLARRYGIRQTPTFVVVSGGREVTRLVGMQSAAKLLDAMSINPGGPLIATRSTNRSIDISNEPRTRLAPMQAFDRSPQTLISADSESSEAMPSVNKANAVELARAATVRLRVHDGKGYGAGTGTIIDTHDDEALVLTCGHLFRDTKGEGKIEVDLFVGGQTRTVLGQVIDYDADDRDIALVAIRPGFPVTPVKVVASNDQVRTGQAAFSYGCDRGDDPSRRDTRITGINKYNQHIQSSNLEIEGAPIDGRSGGGLFDDSGRLIGVCNAADYKSNVGIYAGPGEIRWQLEQVNLSHLYQQSPANTVAQNTPNAAPAEKIASLPESQVAPANFSSTVTQPSPIANARGQEVIVIVRDRGNPNAASKVMTVANPTAEFMQMVQQAAH